MRKNPYSIHKVLNHLERIQNNRPVCIQLDITNICNHNCINCCSRTQLNYNTTNNEWDLKDLSSLAKDLKKIGIKAIVFTGGGEPLCHKHCKNI